MFPSLPDSTFIEELDKVRGDIQLTANALLEAGYLHSLAGASAGSPGPTGIMIMIHLVEIIRATTGLGLKVPSTATLNSPESRDYTMDAGYH
jgi:hypothetical protein